MENYRSIWTALIDVPFQQSWVHAKGIKTRYAHAGQSGKPVVIMLHGTAGSWEGFAENLGPLAQHFDCYAIDMVGCGYSDKPDTPYETSVYAEHVRDFMDAMQIQQASFIGCSLGSWVAARVALNYPTRVQTITLLSAAGYFANASNMNRIKGARTKAVDDPRWENIKPIFDHLIHDEANRIPDIIAVRQRIYRQPEMPMAMGHILCLQDPEIRQRNLISEAQWASISVPALVIASLEDKDEYLETAKTVARLMPNAQYVEMPNVGHWPHFEDPATFNQHFIQFLNGQKP
ncbi:MAG: alpha/beta hydrolase [Pseudomonadota bacterium]